MYLCVNTECSLCSLPCQLTKTALLRTIWILNRHQMAPICTIKWKITVSPHNCGLCDVPVSKAAVRLDSSKIIFLIVTEGDLQGSLIILCLPSSVWVKKSCPPHTTVSSSLIKNKACVSCVKQQAQLNSHLTSWLKGWWIFWQVWNITADHSP